jgi:RNA polymerase sigma-70 factor (ECF subfamily)
MTEKAFLNIVMPFRDKIYRLAKRLLISEDEAQDATQEMYVKLWNHKENLDTLRSVEAFTMTMTKNYCLDRLKSKQANNLKIVHSNMTLSTQNVEKEVEVQDQMDMVHNLINRLPETQRMVIQLRDVEGYEYEEIENMLHMKQATVRANISRARKAIREQLVKQLQYDMSESQRS